MSYGATSRIHARDIIRDIGPEKGIVLSSVCLSEILFAFSGVQRALIQYFFLSVALG